ncbi:MAG: thiamine-binding protein [Bacteroidota bacterium]
MQVAVEISMYPLTEQFEPPIIRFIQQLKEEAGIQVYTNELSTQVAGEYDLVMDTVQAAIKASFGGSQKCSFVLKVLNIEMQPGRSVEV